VATSSRNWRIFFSVTDDASRLKESGA
jgi:hypothetical protein